MSASLLIVADQLMLKVAFLTSEYPAPSHAWMRREWLAVEASGVEISRYSVRRWKGELVDPEDISESRKTRVILEAGVLAFITSTLVTAITSPIRFLLAVKVAFQIGLRSERGLHRHVAYLVEACILRGWLRRSNVDHIHVHFGTNPTVVAMLCRLLGGPPYSFTVHGPHEFDVAPKIALGTKAAHAAFVVTISDYGQAEFAKWCDPADRHKVHVVYCGVDDAYLTDVASPIPDVPIFVCVGRLDPVKGQIELIDAVERIVSKDRAIKIVLVGDGPSRQAIERHARELGVSDHVTFAGMASGEEVRRHILSSRALVLPSYAEGLPVVIMEALAMHRPVIATDVAGVSELVQTGKTGWLIPPGDVAQLTEALAACLEAPVEDLAAMAEAGASIVRKRHHASIEAGKLRELITRSLKHA
ncbi:MAG: glycosyltransferase [Phycisphaera sp.]|nr:glycosyltransferase [Phycisphaera sp.]